MRREPPFTVAAVVRTDLGLVCLTTVAALSCGIPRVGLSFTLLWIEWRVRVWQKLVGRLELVLVRRLGWCGRCPLWRLRWLRAPQLLGWVLRVLGPLLLGGSRGVGRLVRRWLVTKRGVKAAVLCIHQLGSIRVEIQA